jgi:hypothetical protein
MRKETINPIDRFILKHAIAAADGHDSFDVGIKSFGHGYRGVWVADNNSAYELDLSAIDSYPGATWFDGAGDPVVLEGFFPNNDFVDDEEGREALAHHITKWVKTFVENPRVPRTPEA